MPKFYLTTPIYYVNDKPHIGSTYATVVPDVLARYHRMLGEDVYFLTGTDENAEKNVEAAQKVGEIDPQNYVNSMSATWQVTWDELGISNDDFIRTTEERHKIAVEKFWRTVEAKGDIYKGSYEGLYCVGCETFYVESDLENNLCPVHQRPVQVLKEENYFFRLSKYRDQLLAHIKKNPEFIKPTSRAHEVVNYIEDHLKDISISRPAKGWGIAVPGDETQVIYVWFDALINYLTAVGYWTDDKKFKKWWPADLHVVGKDITKFHCALWPAMLLSAGLELPKRVFVHGFFTIDGVKISKSLGNAIDPRDLVETYGLDSLRYFLLREIPFGGDGDFSIERIAARYDSDLANGLGNTISRILALADGKTVATPSNDLEPLFKETWDTYHRAFANNEPHAAVEAVWHALKSIDQYIDTNQPWKLAKDETKSAELAIILGTLLEALRQIGWLLVPLLPETALKLFTALGFETEESRSLKLGQTWGSASGPFTVQKISPLFPRLN